MELAPAISPLRFSSKLTINKNGPTKNRGMWSVEEHDRFLKAIKKYPQGPWRAITEHIGTRSIRQVQTHAQKYQEKVARRLHGSSPSKNSLRLRRDHRIDREVVELRSLVCPVTPSKNDELKDSAPSPQSVNSIDQIKTELTDVMMMEIFSSGIEQNSTTAIDTAELPSLDEALDFFIDCFSANT